MGFDSNHQLNGHNCEISVLPALYGRCIFDIIDLYNSLRQSLADSDIMHSL